MERISLNHWSVNKNNLSISLWKYHVSLKFNNINVKLTIINSEREELELFFNNLEEAIVFTEEIIDKSKNYDEIMNKYNELYKVNEEESKIVLTPNEVEEAIFNYFGSDKNYRVSVNEELTIENDQPKIMYFLIEHLEYDGIKKEVQTLLTNGDIRNALDYYINFYNYKLIDFKYIGGIHRVGYYVDEDTPYYEGIELNVKTLDKKLVLKK